MSVNSNSMAAAPGAEPVAALPPDELKKRVVIAKQIAASFGEIVSLFLRSPAERKRPLEDLEWMVFPALQTGQFMIADAQAKDTGQVTPVGVVMWAMVSDVVDQRLSQNLEQPVRLTAQEWRSGPIPWIVAAIGDQKIVGKLLQQLAEGPFKTTPAKMRTRGPDGKAFVGRLELKPGAPNAGQA